ncbi:MAG: N-6 DNA methylase [Pseudomonadota bacterium]|nr:N-6 DNA methylase [Pseudomonadota bacterium]
MSALDVRESFYSIYRRIWADLFDALTEAAARMDADRAEVRLATQWLLDRMVFLYCCEDSPAQLLPRGLTNDTCAAARRLSAGASNSVYAALKLLFRDIGERTREIRGYDGALFEHHRILDVVDLPDSLHESVYSDSDGERGIRRVQGVWGLHAFDFGAELNEHVLGHLFEESLSGRKRHGVFYTSQILADFLCTSAIAALVDERAPVEREERGRALRDLRVVDLSCGAGAFLVSALHALGGASNARLYGIDLSPQAVEVARLALWLRAARTGEPDREVAHDICAGDALRIRETLARLPAEGVDLVVGNPPWGACVDPAVVHSACTELGVEQGDWDSWELFILLALRVSKPGGRIALVLPDTIFSRAKAKIRRILLEQTRVEKLHNLGADWFGSGVRMGTVLLQARKGPAPLVSDFSAVVLTGELRRRAIKGQIQLSHVEAELSLPIPQERCRANISADIEVFRSRKDDAIMLAMAENGVMLGELCERARGEELSKDGLVWVCPSCGLCSVPGRKQKGGGYDDKECSHCGYVLRASQVETLKLVAAAPAGGSVPFVDGDDISARYAPLIASNRLMTSAAGFAYKDPRLYASPKILIRQAGVGINAALDLLGARCPQSVYIYRLREAYVAAGYRHEFLLAALLSRTFSYYVFKRFGEVDPARAHAKMTHERLHSLPVPKVDFSSQRDRGVHEQVVASVTRLLSGASVIGGEDDLGIERGLRTLWGLSPDDGAFINGEFSQVPQGQVVRELFPHGPPRAMRVAVGPVAG